MTSHQCGDSALDPSSCEACRYEPVYSSSVYELAARAMERTDAGLCAHCGIRPLREESSHCQECHG